MRKPTRFTKREQIIAKIDKFAAKAKDQRNKQTEHYLAASRIRDTARQCDDVSLLTSAKVKESTGDMWGKKAERIELKVLSSLKRKLAEFDTDTIPGITDDKTVEGL